MTTGGGKGRLSGDAKAAALRFAGGAASSRRPDPQRPETGRAASAQTAAAPKFSDLPGFQELRTKRQFGQSIGLADPFFHPHEGRAGATSMIDGRECLNFASYDYAGLNGHPRIVAACKTALDRYGVSASASRVVAGERPIHGELEAELAKLHSVEAALSFVSGHATNVAAIGTLMGPKDLILHDALSHNSLVVGAQLSGAARRSFAHNDMASLRAQLEAARGGGFGKTLIVVEGVYSMDGDAPDLAALVALKREFGAWLMVDEAHAVGVLGATGRGLAEHCGVDPRAVDIWMGTFSKTFAGCGGYIAGEQDLIDYLKATAPGFVYSVGLPPVIAAAVLTAAKLLQAEPERVRRCQENGRYFLEKARAAGFDTATSEGFAVVPVIAGSSPRAVELSNRMLARGVNVLPIIHPAVPEAAARLRFFLTSEHSRAQMDQAIAFLAEEMAAIERDGDAVARFKARAGI